MMKKRLLLNVAAIFAFYAGAAQSKPMSFELSSSGGNCGSCEWIAADGEIEPDTAEKLAAYLREHKLEGAKGDLVLNSPGGSLAGGLKLGEFIRRQGLSTSVGKTQPFEDTPYKEKVRGVCASSCAFAFLGGVTRSAEAGEIGVHQFYQDVAIENPTAKLFNALDLSSQQLVTALIIDYVFRMGADPRVASKASSVSPADMHFFSTVELQELKIVWDPGEYAPWEIEPYGAGIVAFTKSRDKQKTVTLFCRSKDRIPRMLITEPAVMDVTWIRDEALPTIDAVDVFGMTVPSAEMRIGVTDGRQAVEIRLAGFRPEQLTPKRGENLAISIFNHAPHFAWGLVSHSMKADGAFRAGRVALRNCI